MIWVAVAVLVVGAAGVAAWLTRHRSLDALMRDGRLRKVLVTLDSGEAFEGVLSGCDAHTVVLVRASQVVSAETTPLRIDGELVLPRSDIRYLQRP